MVNHKLFQKYQKVADPLRQGTGIGLSLCKVLVNKLGGMLSHDDTFDSGVPGQKGTRFVIDLPIGLINKGKTNK